MADRVLITGGAGFIGSHTADLLAKKGYKVRILDDLKPPVHDRDWPDYVLNKGYELIKGDVSKKNTWLTALRGVDYVFGLAAHQDQLPNFSKFFEVNTLSNALLYEVIVAKKLPIKKIVFASSQFIYGDGVYICPHTKRRFYPDLRTLDQLKKQRWDILCPQKVSAQFVPFREDQQPNPTNSYGLSKVALENLALRLGKTYNIPTTILRYSIVQGPRQSPRNLYSGSLRIFVTQALEGEPITVYEDGQQKRDFVNIEDIARSNVLALENDKMNFQIFNAGGGKGYTVLQFAEMVKRLTKSTSKISLAGEFRQTDTRNAVSSVKKLQKFGWKPKFSPEKSIRDYVDWVKDIGVDRASVRSQRMRLRKLGVVEGG